MTTDDERYFDLNYAGDPRPTLMIADADHSLVSLYECNECSAIVADPGHHVYWHREGSQA